MITVDDHRPSGLRLLTVPLLVALGLLAFWLYLRLTPGRLLDSEVLTPAFVSSRTLRHLELVAISFSLAALIGLAGGIALSRRGRFAEAAAFLPANLGQAVPSVGVLALVSLVAGLGVVTTVVALTAFGILPVLRNTVSALKQVDPAVIDAARGAGMTDRQSMWRVRLPLASLGIFAGLRTSLVLIVGTATLGNFVGGGGLGDVINAGLGNLSAHVILTGAVLVAAMAVTLDWLLGIVERLMTPRSLHPTESAVGENG